MSMLIDYNCSLFARHFDWLSVSFAFLQQIRMAKLCEEMEGL